MHMRELGSMAESRYLTKSAQQNAGGITRVADGKKKLEKNARGAAGGNRPYFSLVLRGPAVPALTISYLPYAKYGHKGCRRQYRLSASCRNRPHQLPFLRKKDAGAEYIAQLHRSRAVMPGKSTKSDAAVQTSVN
jgi:hypothetical protein